MGFDYGNIKTTDTTQNIMALNMRPLGDRILVEPAEEKETKKSKKKKKEEEATERKGKRKLRTWSEF